MAVPSERRLLGVVLLGGAAIAVAAVAAELSGIRPIMLLIEAMGLKWLVGLFALTLVSYLLRWLRGTTPTFNRLILIVVGWQIALLVAVAVLLATWASAAMWGVDAAPGLLRALILTLVAGTLVGFAGKALANLGGAIAPGPAVKTGT